METAGGQEQLDSDWSADSFLKVLPATGAAVSAGGTLEKITGMASAQHSSVDVPGSGVVGVVMATLVRASSQKVK
jgi:hypothetical protein